MLVLSRKARESVILVVPPSTTPTTISVLTVELRGDKARLGFEAPEQVVIHRQEVYEAIVRENQRVCRKPTTHKEGTNVQSNDAKGTDDQKSS